MSRPRGSDNDCHTSLRKHRMCRLARISQSVCKKLPCKSEGRNGSDRDDQRMSVSAVASPGSRSPTSARTSSPSSAGACLWTGPSATAQRPCSSRPSSRRPATPAPSTGPPAGSMLAPPRDAGAMIGTSCTTNPARTSGSGPCEKTGNAPSIARICGIEQTRHGLTEHLPTGLRSDAHGLERIRLRYACGAAVRLK